MTRYNCGGPDSPGGTHWSACDCVAERLRREGAEAERRAVLAKLQSWIDGHPDNELCEACSAHKETIRAIEAGEHLRGESEGGCHFPCERPRGHAGDCEPTCARVGESEGG